MKDKRIKSEGNLFDPANKKRGVLFLDLKSPKHANGYKEYKNLKGVFRDRIDRRIGDWIGGGHGRNGKFHHGYHKRGFRKYKSCYTFKDIDNQLRLHGFLFHPVRWFQLCVITHADTSKKENPTNTTWLDRVLEITNAHEIVEAVRKYCEEHGLSEGEE